MSNKSIFLIISFFLLGVVIYFVLPKISPPPPNGNGNNIITRVPVERPKDKETCLAKNGKWAKIGLFPEEECNLPTSDAGRECSDVSQCEGTCLADLTNQERDQLMRERKTIKRNGKCTPYLLTVGCQARVENGQINGIFCMD